MKSKPHPVLVLCLFAVLSTVTGRIIFAQETDEKKSAFEVGDLINLGIPIDNYFRDIGEYGEIPTYFGLQAYIEDYYKEILEELNAFKDQSSIEVDVRYEEETRRVLLDVDFYMKTMHRDDYWSAQPAETREEYSFLGSNQADHDGDNDAKAKELFCLNRKFHIVYRLE